MNANFLIFSFYLSLSSTMNKYCLHNKTYSFKNINCKIKMGENMFDSKSYESHGRKSNMKSQNSWIIGNIKNYGQIYLLPIYCSTLVLGVLSLSQPKILLVSHYGLWCIQKRTEKSWVSNCDKDELDKWKMYWDNIWLWKNMITIFKYVKIYTIFKWFKK